MDLATIDSKIVLFGDPSDLLYWSTAIAGETGELCNLVKKIYRDFNGDINPFFHAKLKDELADIFNYFMLFCRVLGYDPAEIIMHKLIVVDHRRTCGSNIVFTKNYDTLDEIKSDFLSLPNWEEVKKLERVRKTEELRTRIEGILESRKELPPPESSDEPGTFRKRGDSDV